MIEPVYEVSWDQLPDMPVGKWEPASLVLDDKLYVCSAAMRMTLCQADESMFSIRRMGPGPNCRTARAVCPMSTWSLTAMASGLQEA